MLRHLKSGDDANATPLLPIHPPYALLSEWTSSAALMQRQQTDDPKISGYHDHQRMLRHHVSRAINTSA
jgi:hypothetical protein